MPRPLRGWVTWALLTVALAVLAYTVLLLGMTVQQTSDGLGVVLDQRGLLVSTVLHAASKVRPGDIITHIDGQPLDHTLLSPGRWGEVVRHMGISPTYTVLRDGQSLDVPVSLQRLSLGQVLARLWVLVVIGATFIASSLFIIGSRSSDPAVPWLALAFAFEGLNLVNNAWVNVGANVVVSVAWMCIPLDLLSFALVMSLTFHVFLVFPEPKWLVRRFPHVVIFVHILNVLVALGGMWVGDGVVFLARRAFIYRYILYPLAGLELALALGHLLHTYITTHRRGVRNQIRLLMWGMVLGPLPWLLLYNLPNALWGGAWLSLDWVVIPLVLIPLTFVLSVTQHGLMAADVLINRSLVYVALSGGLVGLYLGAIAALEWLASFLFGATDVGRAPAILAIIVVALAANPLRARVQRIVDRAFYRRRLDFEALLTVIEDRLSTTLELDALSRILVEDLPAQLHVRDALLALRQEDGSFTAIERDLVIPAQHYIVKRMHLTTAPVIIGRSGALMDTVRDVLGAQWEVLLPLCNREQLVGIYCLGPRYRGDLYTPEEVSMLAMLGRQVALTLDNVRLYQEVARYTQNLETLVTQRTQALADVNQNLTRERDRLSVILEHIVDGLMVTDAAGHLVLSNPALAQILGHRVLETRVLDEVPEWHCLAGVVQEALDAESVTRPFVADCEIQGRILRAVAAPLPDQGGVVTVLRDITRERRVEHMKTEFVATISHELRTPLTAVLGFAKLVYKVFDKDVVPALSIGEEEDAEDVPLVQGHRVQRAVRRIYKNVETIIVEAERLTRLINDVLDIAKLESGELPWHDKPLALGPLIEKAVEVVRLEAEAKGLALVTDIAPELPIIEADPERIRQVLANLLSNAAKFTDAGTISVRASVFRSTSEAEIQWQPPPGSPGGILISVTDTGIGIAEPELPHLFRRFYQVRMDTLIDKPRGAGLGLAISREIVTHYGGVIWARSSPGLGSKFAFVLPLPSSLETVPEAPPDVEVEDVLDVEVAARPLVLIVDDEPAIRALLAQELEDAGYRVREAANGSSALVSARRTHPAAIILDLMLPDISGFDVARLLKADAQTAKTPIIVLSILEDRARALDLGIDVYFTKPVDMSVLLQALARVIKAHMHQQSADFKIAQPQTDTVLESLTGILREHKFDIVDAYAAPVGPEVMKNLLDEEGNAKGVRFEAYTPTYTHTLLVFSARTPVGEPDDD